MTAQAESMDRDVQQVPYVIHLVHPKPASLPVLDRCLYWAGKIGLGRTWGGWPGYCMDNNNPNNNLNKNPRYCTGRGSGAKSGLGSWVLVDIENSLIQINLISMIATITRVRISILRGFGFECWVIVGVIVREHNNNPTQDCTNSSGILCGGG